MNKTKISCLSLLMLASLGVTAQTGNSRVVKGRVVSAATGQPVAGAIVGAADVPGFSTLTDEEGAYRLELPRYVSAISVTSPDFGMVKTGLAADSLLADVKLYPATFSDHYRQGANVLSTVEARDFGHTAAITIGNEVHDQLGAQAYTVSRSGTPGIGNVTFVQGLNSLHANALPLVVIDGVIVDQQYGREMLHSGFFNDILSNINPADIESVSLLRNGTALYGAKGANGVLLVKTRRNTSMATRITASISGGVTLEPKYLDMMDASQYRSYASELLKTTNTTITDFKFLNENPNYYYYNQYHNETDWKEKVYRTALTQNYGISVEGGDDIANYHLSLGYTGAQSTLDYNSMNRLNIRFNTDIKFSERLSTRFDASFTNQTRNLRDDGAPATFDTGTPTSPSFLAYAKSPFLSPYVYAGGQLSKAHYDVNDESYLNEALRSYQNYNWRLANPYALNEYADAENKNRFENSLFNVSVLPKFKLTRDLALSEHFSYNLVSTNELRYIPVYGVPSYYVESVGDTRENEVHSLFSKQNSLMSDTRLEWSHRYDAHSVAAFGGARLLWDSYTQNVQLGYNTGNDKTPQIKPELTNANSTGIKDAWNSVAWYAQVNYDYLQRYYLQLNLTAESSSRFGREADAPKLFGVRWGFFPSLQASWVLTNEQWFAAVSGINYLRLHAGIDVSGNDDIDSNGSRSYFQSYRVLDAISGLKFAGIGNKRLQWETTRRLNVGLEGNFLNNRLNVALNYFNSKTTDLLVLQQLSFLTGLESNWSNGGELKNEGFDASATVRLLAHKDWQWELGASMGHYKNSISSLPDGQHEMTTDFYGASILSRIGQPANLFYGYKTKGVFASSEEAADAALYLLGDNGIDRTYFGAGDMHFADLDGNHRIDENDRTIIGDPNPDIYGNIFTTVAWKRLKLDVRMNYSLGNDVYNYQRSQLDAGSRFINQTTATTRRWQVEGQQTDIPRITFQDPMGNARFSDRWIEDGSYLKLRSVTLSYQLPVNSTFLQGLEFWAQANNLFTLTKYLGSDPETAVTSSVLGQGVDTGLLPSSRSFVAGIKINL